MAAEPTFPTVGNSPAEGADAARRSWLAQRRGWATLRTLRPAVIDLSVVDDVRSCPLDQLVDGDALTDLVARWGLNDEGLDEVPAALRVHCGKGLRIWQYPIQFAPYLVTLAGLGVRSYLEVGVRHGGSFVATTEYLRRVGPLRRAVGVDVIASPSLERYTELNEAAELAWINSRSAAFAELLERDGPIDLVFIDSHHEEEHCRAELELVRRHANMIAMHDISNVGCPGIGAVWQELRNSPDYRFWEFVAQYDSDDDDDPVAAAGPFMGIGLAVRNDRLEQTL